MDGYLEDYAVRGFRSRSTARGRLTHLATFFGREARAAGVTTYQVHQYQRARRDARGRPRHDQPGNLGAPPPAHARRPLGLAQDRARLPGPAPREPPAPGLLRAYGVPRRAHPPARPVAGRD